MLKFLYKLFYPRATDDQIPYFYKYSLWTVFIKPIRKWFSVVVIPTIPFSNIRVACYRIIGYKIGKNTFIGMRCYLDDMCYDKIEIGNNVTISYGVYIACHGKNQGHNKLVIEDGTYIGMRASICAKESTTIIGEKSIIGANSLVLKSVQRGGVVAGVPAKPIK